MVLEDKYLCSNGSNFSLVVFPPKDKGNKLLTHFTEINPIQIGSRRLLRLSVTNFEGRHLEYYFLASRQF